MICSVCNQDHSRQRLLYPVGATVTVKNDFLGGVDLSKYDPEKPHEEAERVTIPAYSLGWVVAHCDDGRAIIEFKAEEEKNNNSLTFHHPGSYFTVEGVTLPEFRALAREAARLEFGEADEVEVESFDLMEVEEGEG